eukprot:14008646-Ditylum_brightwellii.AAC.1
MSYLCKRTYSANKEFSTRELDCLKPHDIYQWLAMKAYGKAYPSPSNNPTEGCNTSLKYYKKALSYFMPNCRMVRNELTMAGNPIRSEDANDLIGAVILKEVWKQGKPSQANKAFERPEVEQAMQIFLSFSDFLKRRKYTAIFKFQIHFVVHLDDTCHVKKENIPPCFQFPFALLCHLC